jgi:hypothetical protein
VTALGPDLTPAGGLTVVYSVTSGAATLGCGQTVCPVTATGDGRATMSVTANGSGLSVVTASLSNGSSLQAHFTGGAAPLLAALTPRLSLAAGQVFPWTVQALALANGVPAAGQSVLWQSSSGVTAPATAVSTSAGGLAAQTLSVGPLAEGQQASLNACINGSSQCVAFTALGARPEYATLEAVSGATQSLAVSGTPSQIVLRLLDNEGNPMAGGAVALYQSLHAWTPPCAPHAVCAQGALLATQAASQVSAVDGTVNFAPASQPGVATNLLGTAASGNTSTVSIAIEQHP